VHHRFNGKLALPEENFSVDDGPFQRGFSGPGWPQGFFFVILLIITFFFSFLLICVDDIALNFYCCDNGRSWIVSEV
jgi:hypothetical protein